MRDKLEKEVGARSQRASYALIGVGLLPGRSEAWE